MKCIYKIGTGQKKPPERDPRRVWLPEEQCERMSRAEFNAVRAMLIVVSFCIDAKHDLQHRLELIPHGKRRMNMALGAIQAIMNDIIGTITRAQAQQIRNTMNDMEVKITPKLMPIGQTVLMDLQTAKDLTDCAREKCRICAEDGESCRQCKLYQVMEATTPLEDYGNDLLCPYNLADWEE